MKYLLAGGIVLGLAFATLAMSFESASALTIRHPECRQLYRYWQGLGSYKAFAVTTNGMTCGYSYNYNTPHKARQRALRECRGRSRGARCVIFDAW